MEVPHVVGDCDAELVEDVLVPLVVLVVHLGLDAPVVDSERAERLLGLGVVEGLATRTDLVQKLVPLVQVVLQNAEDLRGFNVPKGLVRFPGLHVLFSSIELLLEGRVTKVETVLVHLKNKVLISLVTFGSQVLLVLVELLISMRINSLQPAYYFELLMEPFVPEGAGLGDRRVQYYCLVLDLNFQYCFVVDEFST